MNIKTLEYIHQLLMQDATIKEKAMKEYETIRNSTYDSETDSYDENAEEVYRNLGNKSFLASTALRDFEEQEW